jgi:predicted Ser/Thr protein kinase
MPELQCRRCATVVPDGALFCHICGEEIESEVAGGVHARLRERLSRVLDGRYHVLDLLGAGGMGVVFLAEDVEHQRKVAIKVLSPELSGDASVVARFAREARTAASLEHPGIVRIYGEASERGLHYFVMQHVEGRSLDELLRAEPRLPIALVTGVLREAAAALAHAHSHGVVHRDVKPENIMLDPEGRVLLADFGISKLSRAASGATTMPKLTQTGGVIGTPHYIAPEHALGQPVDGRADQYALAVVGFQMLAGRVPFDDETSPAILHLHINTAAPRLASLRPDVPPHLEAAIARAMSKAPGHRFPTMEEFAAAVAGPPALRPTIVRLAQWAATLLLTAGLAGGAWWVWHKRSVATSAATAAAAPVKRQTVSFSVTSSPSGATVYVDGRRIGLTPIVGGALSVGAHQLRLERKGYRTTRATINVTGRAVRRRYELERERR